LLIVAPQRNSGHREEKEPTGSSSGLIGSGSVGGLRFERIGGIDFVFLMIDGEYPSAVDFYINVRFVAIRYPETIDALILADKIGAINPEGWFSRGVTGDFHDGEVFGIDPNLSFE
jgi:hypothetical protein